MQAHDSFLAHNILHFVARQDLLYAQINLRSAHLCYFRVQCEYRVIIIGACQTHKNHAADTQTVCGYWGCKSVLPSRC